MHRPGRAEVTSLVTVAAALLAAAAVSAVGPAHAQDEVTPARPARRWLVGDLHVHVSPPDAPGHAALTVDKAIAAAQRAKLDFVILTPHRADAQVVDGSDRVTGQELVRRSVRRYFERPREDGGSDRPLQVIAGWEYTRPRPGHAGVSFVDVAALADSPEDAKLRRARALGGLVVVNHPALGPVKSALPFMRGLQQDRRWLPFHGIGEDRLDWNAIEVWHDRSVQIEAVHRRQDPVPPASRMLTLSLRFWDRATSEQRRRITAVGGSDAHGKLPYTVAPLALTSVHVTEDGDAGLRDGLLGAHVTFGRRGGASVRGFTATSDVEGQSARIGDTLTVRSEVRLAWEGRAMLVENGVEVGEFVGGTTRVLSSAGGFAFWRIVRKDAYSNMIYANLPADRK